MKGMRIGYIRVSAEDQNPDRQLAELSVDKKFIDKWSGKTLDRPQLAACMEFIREGDTLVVHSLDRLARNLLDLRKIVQSLIEKGIHVQFVKENLIFTGEDSPMSMLLLSVMGAFAEFERSLIKERQKEGILIAKSKGKYKGGTPKRLKEEEILQLKDRVARGEKKAQIARSMNLSLRTIYNYLEDNYVKLV